MTRPKNPHRLNRAVRGRPRVGEIPYRAPTAEERAAGRDVHCSRCERDWPLALAVRERGLCKNHDRERRRESARAARSRAPDAVRTRFLEAQSGACAVCVQIFDSDKKAIFSCDATGTPRGLVCGRCNKLVAPFENDTALAAAVAAFVGPVSPKKKP